MSESHFCPSCGYKNTLNAKFCEVCGSEFQAKTSEQSLYQESKPTVEHSIHQESQSSLKDFSTKEKPLKSVIYADGGTRLIAYFIDCILFSIIGRGLGWMLGIPIRIDLSESFWEDNIPVVIVSFLYLFLFEAFNNGQTLGKIIMKIRTVDEISLGEINAQQAALHSIGKLFILIDVIIALFTNEKSESELEKNQVRFTQKFSHTSVISLNH